MFILSFHRSLVPRFGGGVTHGRPAGRTWLLWLKSRVANLTLCDAMPCAGRAVGFVRQ